MIYFNEFKLIIKRRLKMASPMRRGASGVLSFEYARRVVKAIIPKI